MGSDSSGKADKWHNKFGPQKSDLLPRKLNEDQAKVWIQSLKDKDKLKLLKSLQEFPPVKGPKVTFQDQQKPTGEESEPESSVRRPTPVELYKIAFHQSLPFIGFGFLDNAIMILAGEYIDHHIGVTLGISTMAAAALGNTISDLFGIATGGYIEHFCVKLGVSPPALTLEQLDLNVVRAFGYIGRAVGIVIGCLLGMSALWI